MPEEDGKPMLGEDGKPMLDEDGKPPIKKIVDLSVTGDKDGGAKNETATTFETKKKRKTKLELEEITTNFETKEEIEKKLELEEIAKEEEKITTALTQVIDIR